MKKIQLAILMMLCNYIVSAQSVSLSPSRLYFKAAAGETKKQIVHVTNNSTTPQSFNISFGDFAASGIDGKTQLQPQGDNEHSCSPYLSASPSFFTLEAGKSMDVQVIIELPNLPEANKVKWGTMILKLEKERTEASNSSKDGVGMGLIETFQFVVHVFQTPPTITSKQAEITSFKENVDATNATRTLDLLTQNTGEAIVDCAAYLEFSNLKTGYEERTKPSAFTILPGGGRLMKFNVPDGLPKGKYTVTAVVDIGSKDAVQAAEMNIEVQ